MADATQPDQRVVIVKNRMAIAQQELAIQQNYVRIIESIAAIRQAKENIAASQKALEQYRDQLRDSQQHYGSELTAADIDHLSDAVLRIQGQNSNKE